MYKLNFLSKENDLNKIIRNHKKDQGYFSILFVSLWDEYCENLVRKLVEAHGANEDGQPLYIVDSFNMPHSFVIYNTTKVPQLVTVGGRSAQSEDYLPMIMKTLLPEKQKKKRSK
jgi:hypothetical protein